MNREAILGVIRHILTFAGGVMVTKGFATADEATAAVAALVTLIGVVWSVIDKTRRRRVEE